MKVVEQMTKYNISNSDWYILRVLWEYGSQTPKEIHEKLKDEKEWSINTIRTLLSRLIKKKLITTDGRNKYPLYSALVTEDDCVEEAVSNSIASVYCNEYRGESESFFYYGYASHDFYEKVSNAFEYQYNQVVQFFDKRKFGKRRVMIHKSAKSFSRASRVPLDSVGIRIMTNYGMFHVSPESSFKNIIVKYDVYYWLTYTLLNEISMELPFYFKQGLSYYLSGFSFQDEISNNLDNVLESISIETLFDLMIEKDTFSGLRMTKLAYLLVDFIINHYGVETIKNIVYEDILLSTLINENINGFIDTWKEYTYNTYKKENTK